MVILMISICLIMKNEEDSLDRCLQHLKPIGYEIVIADTGSTDRSKEIALKYTDKVYDYPWSQDFAAARNYIASKATNDFILFIDCDEVVTNYDKDKMELMLQLNPNAIGRLLIINNYSRGKEQYCSRVRVSRLFSKKVYQYKGMIHEQLVHNKAEDNTYYDIPIELCHEGYDGDIETRSKKTERNLALLKGQLASNPDDPYILYQIGKSYFMQEDYAKACEWFEKALCIDVDERLEYVQDMVESYGYALLEAKEYDKALQLLNIYDIFAKTADFVFLVGLIYMNNAYFKEAIEEFIKATSMDNYKMDGVNSYRAFYNVGVIYECLGQVDKAKKYYGKCGDYKLAMSRLKELG